MRCCCDQVSIAGAVITVNPSDSMSSGVQYTVTMPGGIVKDLAGNSFAGIAGTAYQFSPSECTYSSGGFTCNATGCHIKAATRCRL